MVRPTQKLRTALPVTQTAGYLGHGSRRSVRQSIGHRSAAASPARELDLVAADLGSRPRRSGLPVRIGDMVADRLARL